MRLRVDGVVQGVGFRPSVYVLAEELGLAGFVLNDARGVLIEVEGATATVERFVGELPQRAPPLARIDGMALTELEPSGKASAQLGPFEIRASPVGERPDALVAPDSATCADCLRELFDPANRRYRYPFVNCTNCGPRFTIVQGVPYDRPRTTMAHFTMCSACQAEYDDPHDRRFHAQPNACPGCGPRAELVISSAALSADERPPFGCSSALCDELHGAAALTEDAVARAAALLRGGAIVAVKGVGGFHLACRADDAAAVGRLRARKHREHKPFAVLVADLDAARALVMLSPEEAALLASPSRPIVLATRRSATEPPILSLARRGEQRAVREGGVAEGVAPGLRELGVVLPYSPLHHLLAREAGGPLVLTSGNVSDEPIAFEDEDALARLAPITDAFLLHDRPIHTRTDDSVARVLDGRPQLLRRSRGWVPDALALPVPTARPLLAVGAELKSTFCVARGTRAWLSHHVGDLQNVETLGSFRQGVRDFERLFAVTPELVAHDLHPDLLSTREALASEGVELLAVQHHHAHLAAVLAEHGRDEEAVGAIYDGVGLGDDGTAWGGELLVGGLRGYRRAGALLPVPLPGGDRAAREPWRMACAWLHAAGASEGVPAALAGRVETARWRAVRRLCETGFRAGATTSMGRLFDAVAALCGLHPVSAYEGQAAIALEAIAALGDHGRYELSLVEVVGGATGYGARDSARSASANSNGTLEAAPGWWLDARPTVLAVRDEIAAGVPPGVVSSRFHATVAAATAEACERAAREADLGLVVLSGGVFQNRRLCEAATNLLRRRGLEVLLAERVPPNDGGIAFGQAAIAAAASASPASAPRDGCVSRPRPPRPGAATARRGGNPPGR